MFAVDSPDNGNLVELGVVPVLLENLAPLLAGKHSKALGAVTALMCSVQVGVNLADSRHIFEPPNFGRFRLQSLDLGLGISTVAPLNYVMSFDSSRADLIIQYALLLAGEEDESFDRQLGPIHLIKYVYLADLAYARGFGGKSFTGAAWRFHDFGPWDTAVFLRVEPAARAVQAEQLTFQSDYGEKDWVRYRLRDTEKLDEIERAVPAAIKVHLRREVHEVSGRYAIVAGLRLQNAADAARGSTGTS